MKKNQPMQNSQQPNQPDLPATLRAKDTAGEPVTAEDPTAGEPAAEKQRVLVPRPQAPRNDRLMLEIIAILFGVAALAVVIYFILGPMRGEVHADYSDTIYWAQASRDAGRLISQTFRYAAILPFSGSLLMLPLLGLFGFSMTTQMIGMILFTAIFVAALVWLFRSLGFDYALSAGATGMVILILSSSEKMREIFWGHVIYYSLGFLFFCWLFGLVLRQLDDAQRRPKQRRLVLFGVMLGLTTLAAANGIQVILLFMVPLAGALMLEWLTMPEVKAPNQAKPAWLTDNIRLTFWLGAACVLGLILLVLIKGRATAGYAQAYSTYSAMKNWADNASRILPAWFNLLGVEIHDNVVFKPGQMVLQSLRLAGSLALLGVPVAALFGIRRIVDRRVRLLVLAHASLMAFLLFGFIFGRLAMASWRLSPLVASAAVTTVVFAVDKTRQKQPRLAAALVAPVLALALVCGLQVALLAPTHNQDNDLHRLQAYLDEHDLDYGYATFWRSNALSLLGGPELKVRGVELDAKGMRPYLFQTEERWYQDQPGRNTWFVIVSDDSEWKNLQRDSRWGTWQQKLVDQGEVAGRTVSYRVLTFSENPFAE